MKKFILLLMVVPVLFSCKGLFPYTCWAGMIDYSTYTEKGFFITEASAVSFEYKAVGSVYAESNSGYLRKESKTKPTEQKKEKWYAESDNYESAPKYGKYKRYDIDDAFDKLYKAAVAKGANGVINVRMQNVVAYNSSTKNSYVTGVCVTGMLIYREVK